MLRVESDGPVLNVVLDRPDVRNAFNEELIEALINTFLNIPEGTRAVVLSGSGPSFCAGGDLNWMKKAASYSEQQNFEDAWRLANLFQSIVDCPAVIIAKVHGAVYGGGCGLVAAADVAIASQETQFAFSEVKLGLVPATISPFVIAKIGGGHARSLFTTGEVFGTNRALQIGLIHESPLFAELDLAVGRKLKAILSAGPQAVALSKKICLNPPMSLESAAEMLAKVRGGEECQEGITAFLEKRPPNFKVSR